MNKVTSRVTYVEVSPDRDGQRLDNFLSSRLKGLPRSVIYRIIRTGQVRVNGGRAKAATRLATGDSIRIPPASVRENRSTDIPPAVLKLLAQSICYENHGVMVVDKPAGMAVHGGSGLSWGVVDVVRKLRAEASVDLALDPRLLRSMVDAGFAAVFLGLETPSTKALQQVKKLGIQPIRNT